MTHPPASLHTVNVAIALNAVLAAIENGQPKVLCVKTGADLALPYGPFDPERHRTFEIGLREWVERQTNVKLGFIEQLYTFGDRGREAPAAALAGGDAGDRIVSVGYLALAAAPADAGAEGAVWLDWYGFFPWEDWRRGEPAVIGERIIPALLKWAGKRSGLRARVSRAFGIDGFGWEEERTLDRYELMYEAGLVAEAARDRNTKTAPAPLLGAEMISDHRRILATAIGRLRGKLKYRPVIFEMTPPTFTLLQLQQTVEAIVGFTFHKQNFRRSIERSGFVRPTGDMAQQETGRPAAVFEVDRSALRDRAASGLSVPRLRRAEDGVS